MSSKIENITLVQEVIAHINHLAYVFGSVETSKPILQLFVYARDGRYYPQPPIIESFGFFSGICYLGSDDVSNDWDYKIVALGLDSVINSPITEFPPNALVSNTVISKKKM